MPVKVTVENLGPCKKLLRFEVEAQDVDAAFDNMAKDFLKQAKLPGFRPGKAPRDMVLRKYEHEILDETKRKVMNDAWTRGIKENKITIVTRPDIEEVQFGKSQPCIFTATMETVPDFELPDYRGLPAKREMASVTEPDVDRALELLRGQKATFLAVDRPVQEGDIMVLNYAGTCEGKPITEFAPVARGLTEKKGFWVEAKPESFIPGFAPQLYGAKAGEKRTATVDFPADFVTREVAGKQGVYEVEVVEVKERVLPPLDDTFAKSYEAENLQALREGVRRDLQNELNQTQRRNIRTQVVEALLGKINFELPDALVQGETRNVVYEIVSENQKRGITNEVLEQQKDSIYNAANQTAKDRVKADILFQRIAENEGIRITSEEVSTRITALAAAYRMPPQAFYKKLQERNGVGEVEQQLLHEKVVNFLAENARVEDVPRQA